MRIVLREIPGGETLNRTRDLLRFDGYDNRELVILRVFEITISSLELLFLAEQNDTHQAKAQVT